MENEGDIVKYRLSVCLCLSVCLKLKLPGMCPSTEQWETVFFSGHNHISCCAFFVIHSPETKF